MAQAVAAKNVVQKGARAEAIDSLIKQLGKRGSLDRAKEWLAGNVAHQNVPPPPKQMHTKTFNELIYSFGHNGHLQPAIYFLELMQSQNVATTPASFAPLVHCATSKNDGVTAKKYLSLMVQNNFIPSQALYNITISCFTKRRDMRSALGVVNEMKNAGVFLDVIGYTALIQGFSHGNDAASAQKLFDEMVSKNIMPNIKTMNSIIHGHALNGDIKSCERMFHKMSSEFKIAPSTYSYNNVLLSFSRASSFDESEMLRWFNLVEKKDTFTMNALLEAYSKRKDGRNSSKWLAKFLLSGEQVNCVSFNCCIQAHCEGNDFLSAARWLGRMRRFNCAPDDFSYSVLIVSSAKQDRTDISSRVLSKCLKAGHKLSIVPFSNLINSLTRQNDVTSATFWLQKMKSMNIQPDAKLLQGAMTSKKLEHQNSNKNNQSASSSEIMTPDQAESWFDRLRKTTQPGLEAYQSVILSYCNVGDLQSASCWLDKMRIAQISPLLITFHKIIQTSCRSSANVQVSEVLSFFDYMKICNLTPTTGQFNAVLDLYAKKNDAANAFKLLEKMESNFKVVPDSINFKTVLHACGKGGDYKSCVKIIDEMKRRRIKVTVEHYNNVLMAFSKGGDVQSVEEWFQKIQNPNLLSFTVLIDAFAKAKSPEKALQYLRQLSKTTNFRPDLVMHNAVLDAYAKNCDINGAETHLQEMKQEGMVFDVVTFTIMVDAACNANNADKAVFYFEQIELNGIRANTRVYSRLVSMFSDNCQVEKAEAFIQLMKSKKLKPNHSIYSALLAGCAKSGKSEAVQFYLKQMIADDLRPNLQVLSSVIESFSKSGRPAEAEKWLLEKLPEYGVHPDKIAFNSVLAAYAQNGEPEKAEIVFEKMIASRIDPDIVCYNTMMGAHAYKGDIAKASAWFDRAVANGMKPNGVSFNIIIDACGKCGDFWQVNLWLRKMEEAGVERNSVSYQAAFFVGKNVEEAVGEKV
eukprot:gene407-118_t